MPAGAAPPVKPPTEEEVTAVASCLSDAGVLHTFYEARDGSLWYTWQRSDETAWQGGISGKSPAGLQPFAPAPK